MKKIFLGVAAFFLLASFAHAQSCAQQVDGSFWSLPFPIQSQPFNLSVDIQPQSDAVVGITNAPPTAYTQMAAIIRFSSAGTIQAMNGGKAGAADVYVPNPGAIQWAPVPAGQFYRARFHVRPALAQYDLFITIPGYAEQLVWSNLNFRSPMATVTAFNTLGGATSGATAAAPSNVCNIVVTADTVTAKMDSGQTTVTTTNPDLAPISGCGTTLNCTTSFVHGTQSTAVMVVTGITQTVQHSVLLTWTPPSAPSCAPGAKQCPVTATVEHIYRSTSMTPPYTKLADTADATVSHYQDGPPVADGTYYYTVTADAPMSQCVDLTNTPTSCESAPANIVTVTIPPPPPAPVTTPPIAPGPAQTEPPPKHEKKKKTTKPEPPHAQPKSGDETPAPPTPPQNLVGTPPNN